MAITLDIGKFKTKVRFDKNIPVPAGAGFSDVFTELLTTEGYMIRRSGSRSNEFGEITTKSGYDLYVRYQQDIEDSFTAGMKVSIDGKLYTPQEPPEKIKQKRFYLRFSIEESGRYSGTPGSGSIFVDLPIWITAVEGEFLVQSDLIKNATIYYVDREGQGQVRVSASPANREFQYNATAGTITFQNAFNTGERVYVLYKS